MRTTTAIYSLRWSAAVGPTDIRQYTNFRKTVFGKHGARRRRGPSGSSGLVGTACASLQDLI